MVKKPYAVFFCDSLASLTDQVMILKPAVEQGGGKSVKFSFFGNFRCCGKPCMIAVSAPVLFPEGHRLKKYFQIISRLPDHFETPVISVPAEGVFPFEAFGKGMDVVAVKKSHHLDIQAPEYLERIDGAGPAAGMQQQFHYLLPKMAVPTLTMVAPSWMATVKSLLIPMDRWAMASGSTPASRISVLILASCVK